jgi:hypothetical protein
MFAARQTAALVILPESTSPDPCTSSLCLRSLRAIVPQRDPRRDCSSSSDGGALHPHFPFLNRIAQEPVAV